MPGIRRNLFSVKTETSKSVVSIFEVHNPTLETADITVPRFGDYDGLYYFKLDLSADGCTGKELVMNAAISTQVWHRRLGHLNKPSLN